MQPPIVRLSRTATQSVSASIVSLIDSSAVMPFTLASISVSYNLGNHRENTMQPYNILCILKCGCVTGVLWSFSQILLVLSVNEAGLLSPRDMQSLNGEWYFLLDILTGIWAISIYTLARSYFQAINSAVAGTVIACWFIQSLVTIKGGGIELTAVQAMMITLVTFTSIALSVLAGIGLYEKLSSNRTVGAANEI